HDFQSCALPTELPRRSRTMVAPPTKPAAPLDRPVCAALDRLVVEPQARPYTGTAAPEIGPDSSETRNRTTFPIASGATHFDQSASGCAARFAGVSITLGRMALQRMPLSRYSLSSA